MRELFDIIKNNYDPNGKPFIRPSVRGIIIKDKKIAVVHSMMYDYYKFPGGGIDKGEDNIATLIREVKEEAGLDVIVDSIREYGHVLRKEKGHPEDIFEEDVSFGYQPFTIQELAVAFQQNTFLYGQSASFFAWGQKKLKGMKNTQKPRR